MIKAMLERLGLDRETRELLRESRDVLEQRWGRATTLRLPDDLNEGETE